LNKLQIGENRVEGVKEQKEGNVRHEEEQEYEL
jgi:hypothetical protein